ncbi:MAG: tetratricopeptide repeat protein [Synechococcales cyanobacterium RM1_1_8]|nr:tetratricopeptide repeat protein [Synechococcales cyanobacterium RM1_1_8]
MELLEQDLIATTFDLNLDEPGGLSAVAGLDLETLYVQPQRLSHWQLAHYAAVESWLLDYHPKADSTGLEQMRGYLEAIQHLVELEDWQRAELLFMEPIPLGDGQLSICDRLYTQGYLNEVREAGLKLLGHVSLLNQLFLALKIGDCLRTFGDFKTAETYYNQIISNELSQAKEQADLYGDALGGLGDCKTLAADYRQAQQLLLRRLALARAMGDFTSLAKAELELAQLMGNWGKLKESLSWAKSSYEHSQNLSDVRLKARAVGCLGAVYADMGQAALAEKYLLNQLVIAQEFKLVHQEWAAISNLGMNASNSGQYQAGLSYLEDALLISKNRSDSLGKEHNLNGIAAIHARLGQYEKAMELFQSLLQLSIKSGNAGFEATYLTSLSYCHARSKHPDQTMVFSNIKKSINIFRSLGQKPREGFSTAGLANAYWFYGHPVKAILTILKALWIHPPWASADGRFMLRKSLETVFSFLTKK